MAGIAYSWTGTPNGIATATRLVDENAAELEFGEVRSDAEGPPVGWQLSC